MLSIIFLQELPCSGKYTVEIVMTTYQKRLYSSNMFSPVSPSIYQYAKLLIYKRDLSLRKKGIFDKYILCKYVCLFNYWTIFNTCLVVDCHQVSAHINAIYAVKGSLSSPRWRYTNVFIPESDPTPATSASRPLSLAPP